MPDEATKTFRSDSFRAFRREHLLCAARKVFERDGVEGATMRAIANAAGCTTGGIYPLFASKEEIYATLLKDSLLELFRAVQEAMANAAPGRARLTAGIKAFAEYYQDRPNEFSLGLYLQGGARRRGLTRTLDTELNTLLKRTLGLIETEIAALLGNDQAVAKRQTTAAFAFLMGIFITHRTGRLAMLGHDIGSMVDTGLAQIMAYIANYKPA